jgi:hypothetical protein
MKIKNSIITCSQLILILIFIKSSLNYCNERDKAIYVSSSNTCELKYCTPQEFENKTCIKDNEIIRNQWLNNIRKFGVENCKLTKIGKYSNGDILAYSSLNSGSSFISYFYGLNKDGRPLFSKDGQETPFNSMKPNSANDYYQGFYSNRQYGEGEIFIAKMSGNDDEYLLNFGRQYQYTWLYDFTGPNIYKRRTINVFQSSVLYSIRSSIFNLEESNNFLFAGIFVNYNTAWGYTMPSTFNKDLVLYSLSIYQKESLSNSMSSFIQSSSSGIDAYGNMVSCYETKSKHIACIYICSYSERKYKIIDFDKNLVKKVDEGYIISNYIEENIFFKGLHYEAECGIFIYYKYADNPGFFPVITFLNKKDGRFNNVEGLTGIELNSYGFNSSLYLNDFIKLSQELLCFASVSTEKDILYLITISIFEDRTKVTIRYYVIRTYKLYNYKFYFDLRLDKFKEYIALGSSYCEQSSCEDSDIHYSSLIIFSFPTSKDISKDIIDELLEKNQMLEDINFNLNLNNHILIENNIFGLIYSQIEIKSVQNCDNNIKLVSSKNNFDITIGSILQD